MPHQYKPGEVEIVRKVLEIIESATKQATEEEGREWFSHMEKFRFNLLDEISSLESVKEEWEPPINTIYWYITSYGETDEARNVNDSTDQKRIKAGNCFPDEASCEVAAAKFIKMLEG